MAYEPGVAQIKSEYILKDYKPSLDTKYVSASVKKQLKEASSGPPMKRMKLKGRNKDRPKGNRIEPSDKLCTSLLKGKACSYGDTCKFSHDIQKFVAEKPEDLGPECYLYETYGQCPFGIACRYAKSHLTEDFENKVKPDIEKYKKREDTIRNILSKDLQHSLWKRKYDFSKADAVLKEVCPFGNLQKRLNDSYHRRKAQELSEKGEADEGPSLGEKADESSNQGTGWSSSVQVTDDHLDISSKEKKYVLFSEKLYLAPLTTVGNLPFRRICKRYGADVTCGEMAVCTNLLQGQQSEWALLKRHESEDLFGVQLCGGYPDSMTRCAQLICETMDVDFIDINCGCPIDLIFNKGEGSALMGRQAKFEQIVKGMKSVMNVPLTVKLRTGIYEYKNIAHTIVPHLRDWGVSLTTLHGRSRMQRYTKTADWDYINMCAEAARPMPLFGNGDILSYEEANYRMQQTGVSGVMIARGALIKPWIFTEIKEQRHWDISSSERFQMLKDYVNFGLDHWGSDQQGVQNTRRFLLEWLSFLYRYIPVGLLERLPQMINERPPYYRGRDDLETLMASPNCGDWIKISEMLLGPVPDDFTFLPKHKANAYK